MVRAHLPAGIRRKASNVHPELGAPGTSRKSAGATSIVVPGDGVAPIATSKLDDENVSFELLAMEICNARTHQVTDYVEQAGGGEDGVLTGNDVFCVIRTFILDETVAIHSLDLSDGAVTVLIEEVFNFLLAGCVFFFFPPVSRASNCARETRQDATRKRKKEMEEKRAGRGGKGRVG